MPTHCYPAQANPKVYLDLQLGRTNATPLGRVVVELKEDVVPKTSKNFEELSKAEPGNGLKGSRFHRIITDFMCQVCVHFCCSRECFLKGAVYECMHLFLMNACPRP